jgi:glycosyltransferase involved in cell wall biosynthesis
MKILQVIPYFNPTFGGDVKVCGNLSMELAKWNHEVTIITTDFRFDLQYAEMIRANGVNVITFPCVAKFGLFLYSPSLNTWLKKNLKDYTLIHLHEYRSYQNIAVQAYAMKYDIHFIVQAHGSVLPIVEKQILKKLYDLVWGHKLLRNASKLVAVSKIEEDQYIKMGSPEKKIEIIPNGIDMSEYKTLPERGIFRKKYGIGSDEKIILFLGRLHKRKGIDFLINSFSRLLDQSKNSKLVIVGPDSGFLERVIRQTKKLKIDQHVLIVGPVSHDEKIEVLVDADVLVYPGILEIFGLVPFEAIMCGTPVIVADDCGCGEVIEKANCGYLVKYGDIAGLNKKIIEILTNPHDANERVKCGQQYIKENLSYEILIKRFLKLYDTCM